MASRVQRQLANFEDSKCTWGYMTLCTSCIPLAPKHVNTAIEVKGFPTAGACELCGHLGITNGWHG